MFKKIKEMFSNETETAVGGIFGLVAIVAILFEMNISNFDSSSIAGGIKDIFSTLVVVVLLFKILKDFLKKSDFRSCFDNAMEQICVKYKPLISKEITPQKKETNSQINKAKHLKDFICYEISNNVDSLFDGEKSASHRFVEIDNNQGSTVLKLLVRTKFFKKAVSESNTIKDIATRIKNSLESSYPAYNIKTEPAGENTNVVVTFDKLLKSEDDALAIANLIDKAIFLYVLEAKLNEH